MSRARAFAPGRVNLIGDHTDYSGGLVLPMAIQLGTTVDLVRGGDIVVLTSAQSAAPAVVSLAEPWAGAEGWARYVAGVVEVLAPAAGGRGTVSTTLPVGAGLSSSAALEVAVALALGLAGPSLVVAQACQRAEQAACGVPCGIMDQLASAAAVAGHALLIDCTSLAVNPIAVPAGVEVVVVHSEVERSLAATAYATRRDEVTAAATALGRPLRTVEPADVQTGIADPVIRRRARHVVSENTRVRAFAAALTAGDLGLAGTLMGESHASLAQDFDVSLPALDDLVARLAATPGVFGARLTGAGFGGCAVALCQVGRGAALAGRFHRAWVVTASAGARVEVTDS